MKHIKRSMICGGIFGGATFVLGFGVLYVMWESFGKTYDLPGLFYYKAAAYGDSCCLPVVVGAGVSFCLLNKGVSHKQNMIRRYVTFLSALCGITMQASWLIRDNTVLNWTIPSQHHFNIAGWYHAVFLVLMFIVVSHIFCSIIFIVRNKTEELSYVERIFLLLFIAAGTLFVMLWATDNYGGMVQNGVAYLIICLGLYLLMRGMFGKLSNDKLQGILFSLIVGIMAAMGICFSILCDRTADFWLVIAGTTSMVFLWSPQQFIKKQNVWELLLVMGISATIYYELASGITLVKASIVIVIWSFLLFMFERNYLEDNGTWLTPVFMGGLIWICRLIEDTPDFDFVSLFLGFTVIALYETGIKKTFTIEKTGEKKLDRGEITKTDFVRIKSVSYLQIVAGIVAIVIMLGKWLIYIAKIYGKQIVVGEIHIDFLSSVGQLVLLLVAFFAIFVYKHSGYKYLCRILMIGVVGCSYAIIIRNSLSSLLQAFQNEMHTSRIIMCILVVFANLGGASLVRHGYEMNLLTLRGLGKAKDVVFLSYLIGITSFIVSYSASIVIIMDLNWANILLSANNIFLVVVVFPILSVGVMEREYQKSNVVNNTPLGGVAQDCFMGLLIILFIAYLPCFYCGIIDWSSFTDDGITSSDPSKVLVCVVAVCTLIASAIEPVIFCLLNNIEHLTQTYAEAKKHNEMEIWDNLHRCLNIQSRQAVIASLPYILIVFAKDYIQMDNNQRERWKEVIEEKYFDKCSYEKDCGEESGADANDLRDCL